MKKWNELPKVMQNDKVKYYYDILLKHEKELKLKREELLKNIPWLEKRIMKSFPNMKSTKYDEDTLSTMKEVDNK